MPLYFAYGANMDRAAMAERCPRSTPIGPAMLMRHRLAVMREGWLTVARDPRLRVHGVLWELALADMPALDRFEGVAVGLYVKATQPVISISRRQTGAGLSRRQRRPGTRAARIHRRCARRRPRLGSAARRH